MTPPEHEQNLAAIQEASMQRLLEIRVVLEAAGIELYHPLTLIAMLCHVQSCYMGAAARHVELVVEEKEKGEVN